MTRGASASSLTSPVLVIEPAPAWPRIDLHALWSYRGLLGFLVWRDLRVRYAQTALGAAWAVLQPLLSVLVFTLVFGVFARIPSDGVPYPAFALSGLVVWGYFATAVAGSSNSLVASANLLTKVYFPRLIIPLAPVAAGLVDYAIGLALLLAVMLWAGVTPAAGALLAVPVATLAAMLTAAGAGCWLSALNIRYRDVKHAVPFLVQVWMYASPVVYPMSLVPERYRALYALNPMAGVIEGFRAGVLGTQPLSPHLTATSLAVGALLLFSGALYFRRVERVFADVA